jgi:hypothetical protein
LRPSIKKWFCVEAMSCISPVFATRAPLTNHGAADARSANVSKPTPEPTRPAFGRP